MRIIYLISFISFSFFSCAENANTNVPFNTANNQTTTLQEDIDQAKDEIIIFESLDGLEIEGHLYHHSENAPTILLCHQAGYNKHEYDDIAIRLNEWGFNCMSIDQRSGGNLKGFDNSTAKKAKKKGLPTTYVDAEQDILAGINYLFEKYNQSIILWGSSYSSALALHIGKENEHVRAVLSFSPGDYFGKDKQPLAKTMKNYPIPYFITSSAKEAKSIQNFLPENFNENNSNIQFVPKKDEGRHGSKALWFDYDGQHEYWNATESFLKPFLN